MSPISPTSHRGIGTLREAQFAMQRKLTNGKVSHENIFVSSANLIRRSQTSVINNQVHVVCLSPLSFLKTLCEFYGDLILCSSVLFSFPSALLLFLIQHHVKLFCNLRSQQTKLKSF